VPPSTWDRASLFLVADRHFVSQPAKAVAFAPYLDFVWSADHIPEVFYEHNPDIVLGHYMPLNTTGGHDFARCHPCTTVELEKHCGCHANGFGCLPIFDEDNPYSFWWPAGETVCFCEDKTLCDPDVYDETARRLTEFQYWQAEHPEWILYKCDGADPPEATSANACWYKKGNLLFLDITNHEVQDYMIQTIRDHVDLLNDQCRDALGESCISALSLDAVKLVNEHQCCGVYLAPYAGAEPEWVQLFDGSNVFDPARCARHDGFCDIRYTEAVMDWIERLSLAMDEDQLRLVANMGYSFVTVGERHTEIISPDNPKIVDLFSYYLDGVFDESGFTNGKNRQDDHYPDDYLYNPLCWAYAYDGSYECAGHWGLDGRYDAWSYYAGYLGLADSLQIPYYSKNGVWDLYSRLSRVEQDQALEWALASYFLARGLYTSFYICENPDNDMPRNLGDFLPQMIVPLGSPCEDQRNLELLHTRRYDHGFVAAYVAGHPDMPGAPECVKVELPELPRGEVYYRWRHGRGYYDDRVDPNLNPSIELCYQQGLVLHTSHLLCQE
jgi:hypothetical protein